MTTRREFLRNTAGTSIAAAASLSAAQSLAAADSNTQQKTPATQPADSYARQLEAARVAAGVTGASFAYWDGKTLHAATSGLRNSVTGDPVTDDTVMFIGSVTKVLSTALMMQLVDEGKISLDDPVVKHVPELRVRDKRALQRITCKMLVNHTNGIDCDWLPEYGPDQERIVDTINRITDAGQLYAPGEFASYSNIGQVVGGYLVQKVLKESWFTLMKTRIYEPLGMRHALVDPLDVPLFRCSTGDFTDPRTGKLVQSPKSFLAPSFAPAGSTQMMTATDLVTFARTLINGGVGPNGKRILSAASAAAMAHKTTSFVPMSSSIDVGLGWMITPGGVLEHDGGGRGVLARLCAHPASGRVMALLTNCDKGSELVAKFMNPIQESWTGVRQPLQHQNRPIDPRLYLGTYENNLLRLDVITHEGGLGMRYAIKMAGLADVSKSPPPARLYPQGDHLFLMDPLVPGTPKMELRFAHPAADGRMRFLSSVMRLYPRTA